MLLGFIFILNLFEEENPAKTFEIVAAEKIFEILLHIKEEKDKTEKKFNKLSKKWKEETAGESSVSSIVMNRNYQKIMGMGCSAIEFILKDLEEEKRDWLWALEMIVDDEDNPITPETRNSFKKSVGAWIAWGKKKKKPI